MHGLEVLIWTDRGCATAMLHNVTAIYRNADKITFESLLWDDYVEYSYVLKFEVWLEAKMARSFRGAL